MIYAIWAHDENDLIGNGLDIPWNCPEDLRFFKSRTSYEVVIMGYKTFVGTGFLPNRINIVIDGSENAHRDKENEDLIYVRDLQTAVDVATANWRNKNTYIIGGAKTLLEAFSLGLVDVAIVSTVRGTYQGDVYLNSEELLEGTPYHTFKGEGFQAGFWRIK